MSEAVRRRSGSRAKRLGLVTVGAVVLLVAGRIAIEPREHAVPLARLDGATTERLRVALAAERRPVSDLPALVRSRRVVLVGEVHLTNEPQQALAELIERLGDPETVLLLELSKKSQPGLDRFLETGDEASLARVWAQRSNLPLQLVLRRVRDLRPKVKRVIAMDENQGRIALNRLFLTDTRNQTMADAIVDAYRRYPRARIVAYGGQMHMLLAGRYRYDDPSRVPAGARLAGLGIPRSDVYSVMLSGRGRFPTDSIWPGPGVVTTAGSAGELPYRYFLDGAVFGETRARSLFDAFVNLGALTDVPDGSSG